MPLCSLVASQKLDKLQIEKTVTITETYSICNKIKWQVVYGKTWVGRSSECAIGVWKTMDSIPVRGSDFL